MWTNVWVALLPNTSTHPPQVLVHHERTIGLRAARTPLSAQSPRQWPQMDVPKCPFGAVSVDTVTTRCLGFCGSHSLHPMKMASSKEYYWRWYFIRHFDSFDKPYPGVSQDAPH